MNVKSFYNKILFNKLLFVIFPILLCGTFIVSVPVANAIGFSTYCSIDREVKIDHPLDWYVKEDFANPTQFSFDHGNTKFFVNIHRYPVLGGPAPSASQFADQSLRFYTTHFQGFSLINGGPYIIQSRSMSIFNPAYYLTYSYIQPNLGPVNVFQVFVHASERLYVFSLVATPQGINSALPIAEQILRSANVATSEVINACLF